jgi:hypothetical protein
METESIILPKNLGNPKPEKKKTTKESKNVVVEKQSLPRTNRTLGCIYCQTEKILNPDQYQKLFDIYETEEKIKEEFFCKPCEMQMKRNPFLFWAKHGELLHELAKSLKSTFDGFSNSTKSVNDASVLQRTCSEILTEYKISPDNVAFISNPSTNVPEALIIKNMPFTGEVIIKVYEPKNNRISIR